MQSDVIPFTLYDTMDYSSVNDMAPPAGFERRDAPQVQMKQDAPPPMQPPPSMYQQGQQGQQMQQGQQGQRQKGGNDELLRQIVVKDEEIDLGEEYEKPKGADIGNYNQVGDLFFLILGVLFIDVVVICLIRSLPEFFGQSLNRWYDLFGLNAVLADVLSIVLGFVIARYIYTLYVKPVYGKGKWSPYMFTGVAVVVQLIHDLGFYFGIIQQVPRGQNAMIDVFKDYAAAGGAKILFGDALLMIFSSLATMTLKSQPMHIVGAFGLVTSYVLPYILYTKNQFSVVK